MRETREDGRRLYKARGPDGEVTWVDHDELWRLQQEQAERLRRERTRRRRLVLLALAGLVAVALVLVFLRLRTGAQPPVPAAGTTAETEPTEREPAAAGETVAVQATSALTQPAAKAVRAWAAAWANQDVDAYLASYSGAFAPADGSSRSSWESLRRARLATPAWIRVEIEELQIALRGEDRAEARFLQSYSSPDYADVVRKTLELRQAEGEWRIVAELAEAP